MKVIYMSVFTLFSGPFPNYGKLCASNSTNSIHLGGGGGIWFYLMNRICLNKNSILSLSVQPGSHDFTVCSLSFCATRLSWFHCLLSLFLCNQALMISLSSYRCCTCHWQLLLCKCVQNKCVKTDLLALIVKLDGVGRGGSTKSLNAKVCIMSVWSLYNVCMKSV